jgi:hypothetical protein
LSHSFIKVHSTGIPFSAHEDQVNITLIDRDLIDWEKRQGYAYAHIGAIKFGLNSLVVPYLHVSSLVCVVDIRHNKLFDSLVGGFYAPLSDAPTFGIVFHKYFVSLSYPYIYELLKHYVLPSSFDMSVNSQIIQLKSLMVIFFGNDTLPPLQKIFQKTLCLHNVVEKDESKQVHPITFD